MIPKQFVRKVLIAGLAVGASSLPTNTKCDQVCRASELPIYMGTNDCDQKILSKERLCPPKIGVMESAFGAVRRQVWKAMDKCNMYQKEAGTYVDNCQEYASSMCKYLSEEADEVTKMGAVGVGAVTGLVLGLRGGIIKKIVFSGVGAYSMSAICYPNETAKNTRYAFDVSRKYAMIGYNFIYGVKKDDIPLKLPQLPKLPSSMGEVWDIAGSLGKSASSLISGNAGEPKKQVIQSSKAVVEETYESAEEKSCHCPVGACLGRHERQGPLVEESPSDPPPNSS